MFIIYNILTDSFSCRVMFTLFVKRVKFIYSAATPRYPHSPQIFFLNEGLHLLKKKKKSLSLFHEERTFITDLCMACGYLAIVKRDLALIGGKTMKKDEYLISSIRLLAVQTEINPSEFVSELKKLELRSDNLPCFDCKVVLCMLYQ